MHAAIIFEHDAKRLGAGHAAGDELAVARLEDVQWEELARQQHERQREHREVPEPRHRRQPIRVAQAII